MKVQISEISNRDELAGLIISELKDIGVKYRKEKKPKVVHEGQCRKRIFRTHLHLLELTDVILAGGGVVQIPKFVADASNRILEQVETEGIFRKAGSSLRLKEIRTSLEIGLPLGKSHHVVDVANVVKSFFRELPEPLIPPSIQETLLRALLVGENSVKAILLTCLLLPPLTLNTLSFFMQFLHTVTLNCATNKMTAANLAIIFTPTLMPFADISSHRFNNHVKVVQLLIENALSIGTIPNCITDKLQMNEIFSNTPTRSRSFEALELTHMKKKKKRRSEMFSGLRKIVGSARGSAENLESTPENWPTVNVNAVPASQQQPPPGVTPFLLKATVKRKFTEPVCAFSAKKKRDLLALLPHNSGGLLPNTPLTKEPKKSRLSLGGRCHMKNISNNLVPASVERRWSIVGTARPKNKNKQSTYNSNDGEGISSMEDIIPSTTVTKCPSSLCDAAVPQATTAILSSSNICHKEVRTANCRAAGEAVVAAADYVRIPKNEYEAIKERVAAIETRITQEFDALSQHSHSLREELEADLSGPQRVVHRYEQMMEQTEALSSPTAEHLAQRLSRGLRIRRSSEQRIMRSPSARKIGTMRRRSQEKTRLARHQTWHLSTTAGTTTPTTNRLAVTPAAPKSNLKRGRPNTLHTGLQQQCRLTGDQPKNSCEVTNWTDGVLFFNKHARECTHLVDSRQSRIDFDGDLLRTPSKQRQEANNGTAENAKTPMLPPKSMPRKLAAAHRTQNSAVKPDVAKRTPIDGDAEEANGRASIARLRTQNAGMVMAKAKLFDGLVACGHSDNETPQAPPQTLSSRRKSNAVGTPLENGAKIKNHEIESRKTATPNVSSPNCSRRKCLASKSPGCVQRRHRVASTVRCADKSALLNTIAADATLTQPRKTNQGGVEIRKVAKVALSGLTSSPKTPKNRKHLGINSPRKVRHRNGALNATTRLRNTAKLNTQTAARFHSPRAAKFKLGNNNKVVF